MAEFVRIGSRDIFLAAVDGPNKVVFSTSPFDEPFVLCKRRWVQDNEVTICPLCSQRFTQLKRKHHCRQCCRVVCSKCCDKKLLLPQLGYFQEAQRVCDDCYPVTQLVTKSRDKQFSIKEEAAKTLCDMCKDGDDIVKVIELGGVQTLIYLSQSINDSIKDSVSDALHTLTTHTVLHAWMVQMGVIKALCHLIKNTDVRQQESLVASISALMIYCKHDKYRSIALEEDALPCLLNLCGGNETISLLAVMTLSLIAHNQESLVAMIDREKKALPSIMRLLSTEDEKMREIALKILASLSLGTDWHRHRIIQEHFACDKCLLNVFKSIPSNQQILVNGVCLMANLAIGEKDQSTLRECLDPICHLICNYQVNNDVQCELSRCLANFSRHEENLSTLVPHISNIIQYHVKSDREETKMYGIKTVINILRNDPKMVGKSLQSSEVTTMLTELMQNGTIADVIVSTLDKKVPQKKPPMSL